MRRATLQTPFLLLAKGLVMVFLFDGLAAGAVGRDPQNRPRSRDLGVRIGIFESGKWNALTDVAGVAVGHCTVVEGADVRTGVTVILPHGEDLFQQKVPAAVAVGNGFGKLVGATQVQELGLLETPIALTNTLSTFQIADALVRETLDRPGNEDVRSVNPVVGECNDGRLNDIRAMRLGRQHLRQALDAATSGPVVEGCVGAGTGTLCMGWKGGIGSASRILPAGCGGYTVGVLVQTNFNGVLSIAGAPVGKELGRYLLKQEVDASIDERGSCIVVVATDAPLDARQLRRLASRALLGLASVGSPMTHGSGDYAIAFSTDPKLRVPHEHSERAIAVEMLRDDRLSPLFQAAKEATEEAVVNSMFKATTMTGHHGFTAEAIPIDRVVEICTRYGVIQP